MSLRVLNEVLDHSQASGHDLCVLIALADAAANDGITWLPVESEKGLSIMSRSHASRAEVYRAIAALKDGDELLVAKVRRGKSTINVYRVIVGRIAETEVDQSRVPFRVPDALLHPLSLRRSSEPEAGTVDEETASGNGTVHRLNGRRSGKKEAAEAVQGLSDGGLTVSAEPVSPSHPIPAEPHGSCESATEPSRTRKGPEERAPGTDLERVSTQTVVAEFIDAWRDLARVDLPRRVVGQLAREVSGLIDEGQSVESIRAGMERMVERRVMQPSLLANFVAEAALAGRGPSRRYGRRAVSAREMDAAVDRIRAQREGAGRAAG